jgi:galactitol-specific phosphotransferase system IIB component
MRESIVFLTLLGLTACTSGLTTTQQPKVSLAQACTAYGAALSAATQANTAKQLTKAQVITVSSADAQASPLCSGLTPVDPVAAISTVTAATTTITAVLATKGATK